MLVAALVISCELYQTPVGSVSELLEVARWTRCFEAGGLRKSSTLYRQVVFRPALEILAGAEQFLVRPLKGPISRSKKLNDFFDHDMRVLIDRRDRECDIRVLSWAIASSIGRTLNDDYGVSNVKRNPWRKVGSIWTLKELYQGGSYMLAGFDVLAELSKVIKQRDKKPSKWKALQRRALRNGGIAPAVIETTDEK